MNSSDESFFYEAAEYGGFTLLNTPQCNVALPRGVMSTEEEVAQLVKAMDIYQHDSALTFRFVLRGELGGASVRELECAWATAGSVMKDKELVVDIRGLKGADHAGIALLLRMRESGARFTSDLPPKSGVLVHLLEMASAASVKFR